MSTSVLEHYVYFIETYPIISQRVSQRIMTSYLGVTPEAFSKAKQEYLKNVISPCAVK